MAARNYLSVFRISSYSNFLFRNLSTSSRFLVDASSCQEGCGASRSDSLENKPGSRLSLLPCAVVAFKNTDTLSGVEIRNKDSLDGLRGFDALFDAADARLQRSHFANRPERTVLNKTREKLRATSLTPAIRRPPRRASP